MRLLPFIVHEALHPVARLDNLIVSGRKTCAHVATAVFAKRGSRHDGDFFLLQQSYGKILLAQTTRRHVGESIKTSARQMTFEADFVEATHDQIAAAVILLAHL